MDTIKMQVHFDMNYSTRSECVHKPHAQFQCNSPFAQHSSASVYHIECRRMSTKHKKLTNRPTTMNVSTIHVNTCVIARSVYMVSIIIHMQIYSAPPMFALTLVKLIPATHLPHCARHCLIVFHSVL